jgi:2-alkenal reductase
MNQTQRLGCGLLALLMFIAFTFGVLGGGFAGVGLFLLFRMTSLPPTATIASPTATAIPALPTLAPALPTAAPAVPTALPEPTASATQPAPTMRVSDDAATIAAVNRVGPSVVTVISTYTVRSFGRTQQAESRGSGVVISPNGYIVTNNHVVEDATALRVILATGEQREAQLVGADLFTDLAVIKVGGSALPYAELGDSSALVPGQRVIAIGSALGDFLNTVTVGVVSGLARSVETDNNFKLEGLIQTDAAINQGNSGGPLVDTSGRVIGVNTLIVGRSSSGVVAEGLGFAMSSNTVREISEQLIAEGRVARPYLGISYQAVTPRLASYYGLSANTGILVTDVPSGSPAARAGLHVGDVILKINEIEINDSNPYLNALIPHRPGETVKLSVNRKGESLVLEATLGQREP